jgi:hypothetical protein
MKSRKIILVVFLAVTSVLGLAALQDNIFIENQFVDINEFVSEGTIITVDISDGIAFEDKK